MTILVHPLPSRRTRLAAPLIAEARERQRRRRLRIAAAIVLLASAGGIGYGLGHGAASNRPSRTNAASSLHPCRLLTSAEVGRALADRIDRRQPPDRGACTWYGHVLGSFTSAQPQLTLSVVSGVTKKEFVKAFGFQVLPDAFGFEVLPGAQPGTMERTATLPLRGIGQAAYSLMNGHALAVWHGQTVVEIDVSFVTSPLVVARRLAARVIDRLPEHSW